MPRGTRRVAPLVVALLALPLSSGCKSETTGGRGDAASDTRTPPPPKSVAERVAREIGPQREAVDYADLSHWGCAPDKPDDICGQSFPMTSLATDGTEMPVPWAPDPVPQTDCFYVYPTVDLSGGFGNHDDLTDIAFPSLVIENQFARFSGACRAFAPYYRQVKIGNYLLGNTETTLYFKYAFYDVVTAFEYYLRHWNGGRNIVILGHSQGAQMATYLLHSYFDGATRVTDIPGSETSDTLRKRLVAGLPIGFNVFVPKGGTVGGSFSDLPLCQSLGQTGCVIHYRSFAEGSPCRVCSSAGSLYDDAFAHDGYLNRAEDWGDEMACVNPAMRPLPAGDRATDIDGNDVEPGDIRVLDGTFVDDLAAAFGVEASGALNGDTLLPGRYTATCRHTDGIGHHLSIGLHATDITDTRGDPVGLDAIATRAIGLHIHDYGLPLGDLISQVRAKGVALRAAQGK